jgi:hypothetical protein
MIQRRVRARCQDAEGRKGHAPIVATLAS